MLLLQKVGVYGGRDLARSGGRIEEHRLAELQQILDTESSAEGIAFDLEEVKSQSTCPLPDFLAARQAGKEYWAEELPVLHPAVDKRRER